MLTTINKKNFSNNKTIDILNKKYYRLHKSDKSKIQKVLIKINDNAYITPHYHKKDEMIAEYQKTIDEALNGGKIVKKEEVKKSIWSKTEDVAVDVKANMKTYISQNSHLYNTS